MVLDFGSFILRGLLVDCVHPAHSEERMHGEAGGCKTRNELEEEGDHRPLAMAK